MTGSHRGRWIHHDDLRDGEFAGQVTHSGDPELRARLAVGETVILMTPPGLPLAGVSMEEKKGGVIKMTVSPTARPGSPPTSSPRIGPAGSRRSGWSRLAARQSCSTAIYFTAA